MIKINDKINTEFGILTVKEISTGIATIIDTIEGFILVEGYNKIKKVLNEETITSMISEKITGSINTYKVWLYDNDFNCYNIKIKSDYSIGGFKKLMKHHFKEYSVSKVNTIK